MPDIAGLLDKRVTILRGGETDGPVGRRVSRPAAIGQRWASVRPDRGTTAQEGQVVVDRNDLIVTLRADSLTRTLTIDDRLDFAGYSYRPKSIEPPNRITGRITLYCVREAD